jgi:hypothetical protein
VVQHQTPVGSPVYAEGSQSWSLHPEIEKLAQPTCKRVTKGMTSVFAGTDVAPWLASRIALRTAHRAHGSEGSRQRLAESELGTVDHDVAPSGRQQGQHAIPGVAVDEHRRPEHGRLAGADDSDVRCSEAGGDGGGAF